MSRTGVVLILRVGMARVGGVKSGLTRPHLN